MRFRVEPEIVYEPGDTKIVTRFLWWPMIINNEFRWLECATIEQRLVTNRAACSDGVTWWINDRWVD